MGLFSRILYGVDLDEEQRRQDELDAQLAALNAKALADGKYTQDEFRQAERNRTESYIPDVQGQVADAFEEGFEEGLEREQSILSGTINTVVGGPIRAVLGGIPFWVWALAALAAFFYFGGLKRFSRS